MKKRVVVKKIIRKKVSKTSLSPKYESNESSESFEQKSSPKLKGKNKSAIFEKKSSKSSIKPKQTTEFELKLNDSQIEKLFLNSEIKKLYPFDPIENENSQKNEEEENNNEEDSFDIENMDPDKVILAYFDFDGQKFSIPVTSRDTFDDVSKHFNLKHENGYISYSFNDTIINNSYKVLKYHSSPSHPFTCTEKEDILKSNNRYSSGNVSNDNDNDFDDEIADFCLQNELFQQVKGDSKLLENIKNDRPIEVYNRLTRSYESATISSTMISIAKFQK